MYEKYSTRECVERLIQHAQGKVECCIFHTHKHRLCFKWCIVLPDRVAWSEFLEHPKSLQSSLMKMSVSVYKIHFHAAVGPSSRIS